MIALTLLKDLTLVKQANQKSVTCVPIAILK